MFIIGTGKRLRLGAADIAIERQVRGRRRRLGHRQRDAENGVGAEPRLVRRAVERAHQPIEPYLVLGFHAAQGVEDFTIDGGDGLFDALAAIALAAIAQFHRLMRAGRSAGRHGGAAEGAILKPDIDFDRRIAAAVENFAAGDVDDGGHV